MVSGRGISTDRLSAALYQYVVRVCGAVRTNGRLLGHAFFGTSARLRSIIWERSRCAYATVGYATLRGNGTTGRCISGLRGISTELFRPDGTSIRIRTIPAGPSDLRFVALDGQGVYVGDGLTLFNTEYAWWGEGDEKVYVDGETFPSHLGTGSEDYYGYAWGRRERITDHPFIAQPEGAGADSAGFVQNTRLRVLDGIPFRTSLRFDMELWHHLRAVVDYARRLTGTCVRAGAAWSNRNEKEAARKVSLHREDLVSQKMEITVEAEHMAVVSKSPEDLLNYHHHGIPYRDIWSNNAQLYWHCNRPGNRLTLSFESVLDGEFDLTLMYGFAGLRSGRDRGQRYGCCSGIGSQCAETACRSDFARPACY